MSSSHAFDPDSANNSRTGIRVVLSSEPLPIEGYDAGSDDQARWNPGGRPRQQLSFEEISLIQVVPNGPVSGGGYCDLFHGTFKPGLVQFALKRPRCFEPGLMEGLIRRLYREGRIWTQLRHENVLPFYGLMEREGRTYLVSPWMQRGDLYCFLLGQKRYLALPPSQQVEHPDHRLYLGFNEFDMIYGIAQGLAYLHAHPENIIHGDIKSQNILLDEKVQPLICDFGLTKDKQDASTSLVAKGLGTRRWQAPELLMNNPKTKASDMYAFGMTMVEILTGDLPFASIPHDVMLILAITQGKRPPCEPLSFQGRDFGPLWDIASRCWDQDPAMRPSAADVVRDLDQLRPRLV